MAADDLVSCPSSSRHKSGCHFFTQRRRGRKEHKEKTLASFAPPMRRSVCQRQNYSVCILERFLFSSGPSHNPPGSHPHSWWTCGPVQIGVPRGFECCSLCGGLIYWTQAQTAVTQTR